MVSRLRCIAEACFVGSCSESIKNKAFEKKITLKGIIENTGII